MKILICVDRLTGGGAQRVAALWINGWCKQGHDVSVVLSNIRTPITYAVPDSVSFYNIDFNIRNGYLRHLLKKLFSQSRLSRIFEKVKPDVVVAVMPHWGPMILKAKGNLNFKVIGTDHNSYERPSCAPLSKYQKFLKFELNKKFDHVTVLTKADMDYIGNSLENVSHLPNPLAFELAESIPPKKKTMLAVGRIDAGHYKGFDILIKAFGISNHSGWILQIAGGGSKESVDKYTKLAEECGVRDSVEFLGFLNDPIQAYRDAGIFVLSSRYEGFGMVLIEAMSQGCACIACDYKGRQREIITCEDEGLVCPTEDPESLAECMNRMMSDDNYRIQVQTNSPKRAASYSLDNIMERWNDIFKRLRLM